MTVPTQGELEKLTDDEVLELLHAYRDEYDRRAGGNLLTLVRKLLAESDELDESDVPIKVVFFSDEYDNGWFYKGYSARAYLKGEAEPIDLYFDDDELEALLADHSDSAGPHSQLMVDLVLDSIDEEPCDH
ncbi:hypothetical protein [Micromonospora maritima]|uniref:hypothetical protein n=1 Tax=Micromonospora maritima TaxID=986711 RepID=UPI00157DC1F6|nr:hypothetical protein [Micromonospora maritima]